MQLFPKRQKQSAQQPQLHALNSTSEIPASSSTPVFLLPSPTESPTSCAPVISIDYQQFIEAIAYISSKKKEEEEDLKGRSKIDYRKLIPPYPARIRDCLMPDDFNLDWNANISEHLNFSWLDVMNLFYTCSVKQNGGNSVDINILARSNHIPQRIKEKGVHKRTLVVCAREFCFAGVFEWLEHSVFRPTRSWSTQDYTFTLEESNAFRSAKLLDNRTIHKDRKCNQHDPHSQQHSFVQDELHSVNHSVTPNESEYQIDNGVNSVNMEISDCNYSHDNSCVIDNDEKNAHNNSSMKYPEAAVHSEQTIDANSSIDMQTQTETITDFIAPQYSDNSNHQSHQLPNKVKRLKSNPKENETLHENNDPDHRELIAHDENTIYNFSLGSHNEDDSNEDYLQAELVFSVVSVKERGGLVHWKLRCLSPTAHLPQLMSYTISEILQSTNRDGMLRAIQQYEQDLLQRQRQKEERTFAKILDNQNYFLQSYRKISPEPTLTQSQEQQQQQQQQQQSQLTLLESSLLPESLH